MSSLQVNEELTLRVVFRDWAILGEEFGDPIDPDTVVVNIYKKNDSTGEFDDYDVDNAATKESVGVYSFVWAPSEEGIYRIEFVGTFSDGSEVAITDDIPVGITVDKTTLGSQFESVFLTDLSPLYIDPEEFLVFHPEFTLLEIAEYVHRYSVEVKQILNGKEPSFKALEYIRAAVLCALSRIYDFSVHGSSSAESIRLGDFSITDQTGSPSGGVNKGNVTNACELAYLLRLELVRGEAGMKAVTTGGNFKNPMPKRHLRHAENNWEKRNRRHF